MSRSNKNRKQRSLRTPKVSKLTEASVLGVGKAVPRHSIRKGKHCPCCLNRGQYVVLKQTTNRALRRKVRQTTQTQDIP